MPTLADIDLEQRLLQRQPLFDPTQVVGSEPVEDTTVSALRTQPIPDLKGYVDPADLEQGPPVPTPEPTAPPKPGDEVDLTPEQLAEYRKQTGELDPLLDFTPEQLAQIEINDPEGGNLRRMYMDRPDLIGDPETIKKVAQANKLVHARNEVPTAGLPPEVALGARVVGLGETAIEAAKHMHPLKAAKDFAVGIAKYARNAIEGIASPFVPEETQQEYRQKAAENLAASELAVTGLAGGVRTAAHKAAQVAGIAKPYSELTDHEATDLFFADLTKEAERQRIATGKGAITQQIAGPVIEELAQAGKPIRPEEVSQLAAGDPFTFYAFAKGFGAAGSLVPAEAKAVLNDAATWVGEVGAESAGTALEGIGAAAKNLAKPIEVVSRQPSRFFKTGISGGLSRIAKEVGKRVPGAAEGVEQIGKQVRLGERAPLENYGGVVSDSAQFVRDAIEATPGAVGHVAAGGLFDVSTAAVMSEFPEEERGTGIGTAFGLLGGFRGLGGRIISGQEIAPSNYGTKTPIPTSGPFKGSAFDQQHEGAYRTAAPAVKQRINAVREFLRTAAPGVDLFYVPDKATFKQSLLEQGVSEAEAELWSSAKGLELRDLNGKPVAFATDIDAAPHESWHPFQRVIGKQANDILNQKVLSAYTEAEINHRGEIDARNLGWDGKGDYRDFLLDITGEGYAVSIDALTQEAAKIIEFSTGKPATPADAKAQATQMFNDAMAEATQKNPGVAPEQIQRNVWRGLLTDEQQKAAARNYVANEISADTWAAVFKHGKDPKGLVRRFAKVASTFVQLLGGEPLEGRFEDYTPLRKKAVEAVREAARARTGQPPKLFGEQPEVTPKTPEAPVAPRAPAPTPASPPGTPEEEAKITRDVAATAPETPTGPEVNAQSQQEILGTMAEAKAGNYGVKITRRSAPGTPAGAIEVSRGRRREQIETARGIPDDQKPLWEKNFTPVKTVKLQDGSIQEQGWSPEVLAANAEKVAKFLAVNDPGLSPFEIDRAKGTFTPEGWKNLFDAVNTFAGNQAAGLTGKGTPLAIGKARAFGFFEPTGNRVPVGALTDAEMNFINYLFGYPLPGEGKPAVTRGGSKQYGVQLISEATEPGRALPLVEPRTFASKEAERLGFAGKQVLEVNPLRAEIEATAKATGNAAPSLIEAWQNLNLRDIVRADVAPELPAVRPVGVTLRAGFKPSDNPRALKSAAIKEEETGKIFTGKLHFEAQDKADEAGAVGRLTDGYVTNDGEFLTREQAYERAVENNQLSRVAEKLPKTGELEGQVKQFKPSERKEIEITGPDGKKYKAMFDGYQDFSVTGKGLQPQITALEDIPGVTTAKSTTYGVTLEKAGFTLPELPKPSDLTQGEAAFKPKQTVASLDEEFKKFHPKNFMSEFTDWYQSKVAKDSVEKDTRLLELTREAFDLSPQEYFTAPREVQRTMFTPRNNAEVELGNYIEDKYPEIFDMVKEGQAYDAEREATKDQLASLKYLTIETVLEKLDRQERTSPAVQKVKEGFAIGKIVKEGHDAHEAQQFLDDWRDEGYAEVKRDNPVLAKWIDDNLFSGSGKSAASFKPSPNAEVQDVAKEYAKENDIPYQISGKPINVNEDLAKRLADFYESAKHDPSNPEVKASYNALADETVKQFNAITDAGYKIEAWKGDGEPYASSDDMVADVRDNKHLWFKRTDESFTPAEGEENLMLKPSGINDWSINDVFRAVHDFFGHAKEGYQFGPKGELNAWKAHSQMYSDEAQGALASETLAQNSWVNYGKHLRGETGAVPKKGEAGYKELTDRPFAEQKNIVVPKELIDEAKGMSFKPKDELKFAKTGSNVFEGSKAWILPNGKVEQLGGEWHHAFLDRSKDLQKKYGLKIPPFEGGDAEGVREQALRKGFARVNLAGASLVVEARQKDWKHIRPIVEDMIDRNLDDIDRFRVSLLDDKADRVVNTYSDKIFDADSDKEKMSRVYDAFSEVPKKEIGPVQFSPMPKNPRAIKQAAVRDEKTGEIHVGMLHAGIINELLNKAVAEGTYHEGMTDNLIDGFVTNDEEFLNREDAFKRGLELKQISRRGIANFNNETSSFVTRPKELTTLESMGFEGTRKFKPKQIEPPTQAEFDDPETIKDALAKPGWAILTATQEKQGAFDTPENLKANEELKADMDAQGLEYFPVDGTYKGKPQGESFVVLGIGPYEAQTLAKKYGQESVSVPRGLLYGDGTIVPGDVSETIVGPEAKKQEFFSTTPEGVSFSIPYEFDKPYKPVGEQEQLFGGREYVSPARLTQEELRQRYPEAIVPKNSNEKIDSDIVGSPLYKKSADPVKAFSDKLVEFAKSFESNPVYQLGLKWYSDFVPVLKEKFGKYAPMMAELLAASSPNETPTQNFYYAVDALEGFKSGRFDKIIDKYNQGWEMMKSDKWQSWYNKELKAGNIPDPPATPTPEAFLGHWIFKHGLKPKQSNGQLYGFHGKAILEVMAKRWLENNKGPKVANFVQNLLGIGHGATIDVWADRTMRRLGYADTTPRWRILPKNGTGVSDADFEFSQKAFESAAKELGITADALQGGLWFAEKSLWADNGWGRLDLGNYITEAEKLPIIQKAIKQRLRTTELRKKAVPMEQTKLF